MNKSPLKTSGTVAICVVRKSCTFSGHPYIGRIARLSLRQHGFLVYCMLYCMFFNLNLYISLQLENFTIFICILAITVVSTKLMSLQSLVLDLIVLFYVVICCTGLLGSTFFALLLLLLLSLLLLFLCKYVM